MKCIKNFQDTAIPIKYCLVFLSLCRDIHSSCYKIRFLKNNFSSTDLWLQYKALICLLEKLTFSKTNICVYQIVKEYVNKRKNDIKLILRLNSKLKQTYLVVL